MEIFLLNGVYRERCFLMLYEKKQELKVQDFKITYQLICILKWYIGSTHPILCHLKSFQGSYVGNVVLIRSKVSLKNGVCACFYFRPYSDKKI